MQWNFAWCSLRVNQKAINSKPLIKVSLDSLLTDDSGSRLVESEVVDDDRNDDDCDNLEFPVDVEENEEDVLEIESIERDLLVTN